MSDVIDDDVYAIDELTEHEITKIEEKKSAHNKTRQIFLSPSKNENVRKTNLRPVFRPSNEFGQTKPMYKVPLHERLDQLIPGTRRTGERTLAYTAPDFIDAFRCFRAILVLAGSTVPRK